LIFWILMLLWLVHGLMPAPSQANGWWWGIGGSALLFILLLILGWTAFGSPVQ
jgi:hypothetical protein